MSILSRISEFFSQGKFRGAFARNTLWMTFGIIGRTGLQVIYFIIIARTLKPEAYGVFAGTLALVSVFAPYVSWGSGNILIKHVSRQSDRFPGYWGTVLSITTLTAFAMLILIYLVSGYIFTQPIVTRLVVPLAIGIFFGECFANVSAQAFQAHQKLSRTSLIWIVLGAYRLLSSIIFILPPIPKTAENWALLFMLSGILSAITGLGLVKKELGWGPMGLKLMQGEWREGFYFAIGLSAQGAYNDIDKTLLVRLAPDAEAGTYSAAYRVIDSTFIPVRAMLYSGYARFFQEGEKGIRGTTRFALRLLPWAAGWGLAVGLCIPLLALFIPYILGIEYAETSRILLWLAPIPLLRSFSFLAADALTGAGYQGLRSVVQIGIALGNLGMNLLLIPKHGWLGAAWSSLISDGLLALVLCGLSIALLLRIKERNGKKV